MKNFHLSKLLLGIISFVLVAIQITETIAQPHLPPRDQQLIAGQEFYAKIKDVAPDTREDLIKQEFLKGNFPDWMRVLERVDVESQDKNGQTIHAYFYVMPDYLMIGSDNDYIRLPIQPTTAWEIADSLGFFLPTSKIVDDIYNTATIKLPPVPMTENRESIEVFLEHHHIIEQQRANRKGLIAGIKKDIISTARLYNAKDDNRVAIYGWHKPDGKAIQPIFVGHLASYVDYSHGVRFVYEYIFVNNEKIHFREILNDPILKHLLCNEEDCRYYYQ